MTGFGESVILKGGVALELRLARARATKDVDLRMIGDPEGVLAQLRDAGQLDLGDYMTFEVQPDQDHPELRNEGMKYDGFRYRVECKLAGKTYARRFGVDIAFADPIVGDPDVIEGPDTLRFAGITPPRIRIYPVETHIAEKLHAFTLPRDRPNSRVKDLPDLALLATVRPLDASQLRRAIRQTFSFRATHAAPIALPRPPTEWTESYAAMATEYNFVWATLAEVTSAVAHFLDPILTGTAGAIWSFERWSWQAA